MRFQSPWPFPLPLPFPSPWPFPFPLPLPLFPFAGPSPFAGPLPFAGPFPFAGETALTTGATGAGDCWPAGLAAEGRAGPASGRRLEGEPTARLSRGAGAAGEDDGGAADEE